MLKDFATELMGLRENVRAAKESYLSGLGEVEPDRDRIECIRGDLRRLFRISGRASNAVARNGGFDSNYGSRKEPIASHPQQQQQQQSQNEKQHKSIFNFAGF